MSSASSLSIVIDPTSPEPKYLQLQRCIEQLVAEGRLKPLQKLPSSRELVAVLRISRTSVLRAIDNLIAEGVLVSRPKKGVFVAKYQPQLPSARGHSLENAASGGDVKSTERSALNAPSPLLAFDSGADTSVFPNLSWGKCMKRAWLRPDIGVLDGAFEDGIPQLKQQICNYLGQLRGLKCEPSQIIVAAGNRDCLSIVCHALISSRSHQIFLEQACYPQIPTLMKFHNNSVSTLQVDNHGVLPPNVLDQQDNLAILTPCRQYPLGMAMGSYRRQVWLDLLIARQKQSRPLWLIEDDYDNEFVYQGRVNVPLMQQDTSGSVFFVGSFSKVLFRGLRLGFIVSPQQHVNKIKKSQMRLGAACSSAIQPALAEFMASGQFAVHLRKMRRHYSHKRDFVLSRLSSLADYFDWDNLSGGMHICLKLKPTYCHLEAEIEKQARELGLRLNPLSKHYLTTDKCYGFLIGFTQSGIDELEAALDTFCHATRLVCQ